MPTRQFACQTCNWFSWNNRELKKKMTVDPPVQRGALDAFPLCSAVTTQLVTWFSWRNWNSKTKSNKFPCPYPPACLPDISLMVMKDWKSKTKKNVVPPIQRGALDAFPRTHQPDISCFSRNNWKLQKEKTPLAPPVQSGTLDAYPPVCLRDISFVHETIGILKKSNWP